MHDAKVFTISSINEYPKSVKIVAVPKDIIEDEDRIPVFLPGDPTYPLMPFLMKYC